MGFSSHVQSRAVHEALLCRQDAELRLLDTMKRCLANKVKCDRDYALALTAVAGQGLKLDRGEELAGSLVAQAWRAMMEEMENVAKLLKQNADAVESQSLEALNNIYVEKRRARKQYQDEYNRITSQFAQLADEVTRKKAEYQKYLEVYKVTRARFEDHYVKAGRGGRKLDEVRDKFQKACRRLHATHNEYVLLLAAASEAERDLRSLLLPGLLSRTRAAHEALVTSWRRALALPQCAAATLVGSDGRVEAALQAVEAVAEYAEFAADNTRSSPSSPTPFIFDDTLVEDTSGKLLPNQLAVDNLTIESLRSKLQDLEQVLQDIQERKGELSPDSRELIELQCSERRHQRQLEIIRGALSELGCEEVPSGCDLSVETSSETQFVQQTENSRIPDAPLTPSQGDRISSFTLKRNQAQQRLVEILRKPFRRKSVPSSPVLGVRSGGEGERGQSVPGEDKVCPITADADVDDGVLDDGLTVLPPCSVDSHTSNSSSSDGGYTTLQISSLGTQAKPLSDEEWFHGVLPREEVVRLLTHEGDYLVRQTVRNDETQTVLSVCWGGHKHFIVQTTAEGNFRFEGPAFPTVRELILHQHHSGLPVTSRSGAILRRPILRERWELNNDDVLLLQKIGRGNFGDVYKARLRSKNEEVAVKTCRVTLPEEHRKKFLQEGRILKQYSHPNVVRLIGICVQKQPIMIVMELVPGGSLLTFLRTNEATLTQKQLLGMCRDAAAGMCYLESRNCIHRDLAARNCLIGNENIVKISDFGMSREEEEYIVSDGMKQIPIKWTAPEALNFGKYTSLCDVWSYGVLAWEIFARGGTPYHGLSNSQARERIDAGYRMPAPEGTPDEMYRLMRRCWEYDPEKRPHFEQILMVVETLHGALR